MYTNAHHYLTAIVLEKLCTGLSKNTLPISEDSKTIQLAEIRSNFNYTSFKWSAWHLLERNIQKIGKTEIPR